MKGETLDIKPAVSHLIEQGRTLSLAVFMSVDIYAQDFHYRITHCDSIVKRSAVEMPCVRSVNGNDPSGEPLSQLV